MWTTLSTTRRSDRTSVVVRRPSSFVDRRRPMLSNLQHFWNMNKSGIPEHLGHSWARRSRSAMASVVSTGHADKADKTEIPRSAAIQAPSVRYRAVCRNNPCETPRSVGTGVNSARTESLPGETKGLETKTIVN